MKSFFKHIITFLIALAGFVGGLFWALKSNWEYEPIILLIVSFLEIISFIIIRGRTEEPDTSENVKKEKTINTQRVNVNVNVGSGTSTEKNLEMAKVSQATGREAIIDSMKSKTQILFIDDDKNFNVVRILKDSGWKKTKTVIDIKGVDVPVVKEAQIFFVDINGVGKLLNLQNEGLDLALMLKQKYPEKKVVIYSANKTSNSFHRAWDECDFKLEKNALPYQFQNLVEQFSIELFNVNK